MRRGIGKKWSAQCVEYLSLLDITLTENSPISGASLKKAEIFYGYFDIFGHPK